jgi:hypothetical protein
MNNDELTDAEFLRALAEASVSRFNHRDHLRMAFAYVRRDGSEALAGNCRATIERLAAAHGHRDHYHETRTLAWASLVAAAASELPGATFEELLGARPELERRDLLHDYYSAARISSPRARVAWSAPDRRPLPGPPLPGLPLPGLPLLGLPRAGA